MFVDDKKLLHNDGQMDISAIDLMSTVTHDLSLWDNYVRVTGGMIERLKTSYGLLTWKFSPSGEP
eukprot:13538757-Ditylum_brightwellii.AAC.1